MASLYSPTSRYGTGADSDGDEDPHQISIQDEGADAEYSAEIDPEVDASAGAVTVAKVLAGNSKHSHQPSTPTSARTDGEPASAHASAAQTNSISVPTALQAQLEAASPAPVIAARSAAPTPMTQRQLAAVIEQSVEFTRAAERIQELQAHIEVLTQRLTRAVSDRDRAEAALVEQSRQHQASEQRIRESYEARMAAITEDFQGQVIAKQQEIEKLKVRISKLEEQGPKNKLLSINKASVNEIKFSSDEIAGLKREIEEQEVLIKGYQQENEVAVRRIKELEEQLKEAEADRAPPVAPDDPGSSKPSQREAASRLTQILTLQKELEALREQSTTREGELKAQLDKLRNEKKDLEARMNGVDLRKMQEDDLLVKAVRNEMEAMRAQHQAAMVEMQAKLRWYVENQELLSKNDALLKEQQDIIAKLEHRLALYEGPQSKSTQQRIRELQAQVASLQQALKAKGPHNSSMAAIIAAAKPSPEETEMVQRLQSQVSMLTTQLQRKEEEYEMQLRSYQQQYEQLKAQFEERQAKLENAARARKREKELQAQVDDMRSMYTRKIKELEAKIKQQSGAASQPPSSPQAGHLTRRGGEEVVSVALLRQRELEMRKLTQDLERKTRQVAEMHLKLGEAEAKIVRLGDGIRRSQSAAGATPLMASPAASLQGTPMKAAWARQQAQPFGSDAGAGAHQDQQHTHDGGVHTEQPGLGGGSAAWALQQRCNTLMGEVELLQRQLTAERSMAQQLRAQGLTGVDSQEVEALRRRADAAEMALATVQKAHTEAVERCALLQSESQRSMLRLHDEVAYKEGVKWQERITQLEHELRTAHTRIEQLQQELAAVRNRQHWTPEASQFAALERKLDEMEQEQAAREAKWRTVVDETKNTHAMQLQMMKEKWELALQSKNAELEKFRIEVEGVLNAARRLHRQQ